MSLLFTAVRLALCRHPINTANQQGDQSYLKHSLIQHTWQEDKRPPASSLTWFYSH